MGVFVGNYRKDILDTISAYNEIVSNRIGGGFVVTPTSVYVELPNETAVYPHSLINPNLGLKPFIISIYNQKDDVDRVSLALFVNPSDISLGQTFVTNDTYCREGWLSTVWGKNQMTLNANCSTAAFYVGGVGVSTFLRNFSIAFKNFASFIGIFKNGGYYFFRGQQNKDLFNSDPGRVISVMDQIKISYDDTEYLGSFSSLTVDENAEMPYRIQFNFEFIVSGLRGDQAEGHLMVCDDLGCNNTSSPKISIQGSYDYEDIVSIDRTSLSTAFPMELSRAPNFITNDQVDNYARIKSSALKRTGDLDINSMSLLYAPDIAQSLGYKPSDLLTTSEQKYGVKTFDSVRSWYTTIEEAADKYGVDPWLLAAMIHQESAGVPNATSHAGARGLMQIMPGTGKDLGLTVQSDFFNGEKSIDAGARYIKQQLNSLDGSVPLALAAYNSGLGAVQKYDGVPPYTETRKYVARISGYLIPAYEEDWKKYKAQQQSQ